MDKKSEPQTQFEKLFGSKTRAKLLKLFFNDPDKSYYVREISREINEQINSVRRELKNLEELGLIKGGEQNNKIYFSANKLYKFCDAFVEIFTNRPGSSAAGKSRTSWWELTLKPIRPLVRALLVVSRVRMGDPGIDLLIVGDNSGGQLTEWAASVEKRQGRELKYVIMTAEDFRYRANVKDKFMSDILDSGPMVVIDDEKVLAKR